MYRQRRLTWLAIAALLLHSAAPALTSLPVSAYAATAASPSHTFAHDLKMPTTQDLLGTKNVPSADPVYVAPDPKTENGPLLGNGTFRLAPTASTGTLSRTTAGTPYVATKKASKKSGGVGVFRLNVSGTISTNTTWTLANSPYVVTSTVTVASPGGAQHRSGSHREVRHRNKP